MWKLAQGLWKLAQGLQGSAECPRNGAGDAGDQLGDLCRGAIEVRSGALVLGGEGPRRFGGPDVAVGLLGDAVGGVGGVIGIGCQTEDAQQLFGRREAGDQGIGSDRRRRSVDAGRPQVLIQIGVEDPVAHRRSAASNSRARAWNQAKW